MPFRPLKPILLSLALLLASLPAFAWPPTFGPEFTFTNKALEQAATTPTMVQTQANLAALEQWRAKMEAICKERKNCKLKKFTDKHGPAYKILYEDGFWYSVGIDTGVLEISAQPNTIAGFRALKDRMQADIFEVAKSIGLAPHERLGQGHMNIGIKSAFGEDAQLFRNFLVDTANHPELHQGVLGVHLGNSPTLTLLGEKPQKAMAQVIQEFDRAPTDMYALSRRIESQVYTVNPFRWDPPSYYQNHRLESVDPKLPEEAQRLEVRGVRPQKSMDEFLLQCELFENWLDHLKRYGKNVPLRIPTNKNMQPGELKARFLDFLASIGEDPAKFEPLLPEKIRAAAPDRSAIPFDEAFRNGDRYQRAVEVANNLSPEQIQEFRNRAFAAAHQERSLHFVPRILSSEEHAQIMKGTEQRARAIQAFLEDIQSGRRTALEAGVLPEEVFRRLLVKAETTEEKIRNIPWARSGMYYAPDVVRHSDGKFYVLEDNTGYNGGMADSVEARRDLLRYIPKYQEVLKDGSTASYAKVIAETLRKMAGDPDHAIALIIPYDNFNYNRHLVNQLRQHGVYAVTENGVQDGNSVFRVSVEDDGTPYLLEDIGDKRIKRRLGAVAIRNFSQQGFQNAFPRTYRAWADGKMAVLGYPFTGFDLVGDKEFSAYLDDLVRFYLKEEPVLRTAPTRSFRAIGPNNTTIFKQDVFDEVFNNLHRYVIKETQGAQGHNVHIGSNLSPGQIADLKAKIQASPGTFVAQDKITISTLGDQITDIRSYATITRHGVETSDQFWGRTLSVHGDGLLNTHQKAQVIPIFVEGRDSVEPGKVVIPDDPRQLNLRNPPAPAQPTQPARAAQPAGTNQPCKAWYRRILNI